MAVCVAVISANNMPLYIKTAPCCDPLYYHFKVHSALDVIEEKVSKMSSSRGDISREYTEQFLGLLYPSEDHRLYGYVTYTKVKFVIIQKVYAPGVLAQIPSSLSRSASPDPVISGNLASSTGNLPSATATPADLRAPNSGVGPTGSPVIGSRNRLGSASPPNSNSTSKRKTSTCSAILNSEADVCSMFQQLHAAYVTLVSSPFYTPGTPIDPLHVDQDNSGNELSNKEQRMALPAMRQFNDKVLSMLSNSSSPQADNLRASTDLSSGLSILKMGFNKNLKSNTIDEDSLPLDNSEPKLA